MDHMEYLGDDISAIAKEKVEIIKNNGFVVTSFKNDALEILNTKCLSVSAQSFQYNRDFSTSINSDHSFNYSGLKWKVNNLKLTLKGLHQVNNAAISICIAEILMMYFKYSIDPEKLRIALLNTFIEGRMEYLNNNIPVIMDGGHNIEASKELVRSLKEYHPKLKFIFLISMLKDKDFNGFIKILKPISAKFVITQLPNSSRSLESEEISKIMNRQKCNYEIFSSPEKALKEVLSYNKPIVICGSLYLIGYIKENLLNEKTRNNKR